MAYLGMAYIVIMAYIVMAGGVRDRAALGPRRLFSRRERARALARRPAGAPPPPPPPRPPPHPPARGGRRAPPPPPPPPARAHARTCARRRAFFPRSQTHAQRRLCTHALTHARTSARSRHGLNHCWTAIERRSNHSVRLDCAVIESLLDCSTPKHY